MPRSVAITVLGLAVALVVAALLTRPSGSGESTVTDATPAQRSPADAAPRSGSVAGPALAERSSAPDIPVLRPAPELTGLDGWLQADGLERLDQLRGSVVVLQFWTFSCSNCKATIPNLQTLRDAHADRDDFTIVGVHYPEFPFEEDPEAIAAAAADLGVTWPIALDTRGENFHGWQEGTTGFWPRTYVLDRAGDIRFDHVGEGRYDELNTTVATLLAGDA